MHTFAYSTSFLTSPSLPSSYDHPPNKNVMSQRLALQVLHTAFAEQELWNGTLRYTGPVVVSATVVNSTQVAITFVDWTAEPIFLKSAPACKLCCTHQSPFTVRRG